MYFFIPFSILGAFGRWSFVSFLLCRHRYLNPCGAESGTPWYNCSITYHLIPWIVTSSGHRQLWYWLYQVHVSLSFTIIYFSYLRHHKAHKWENMQIHFCVSLTKISTTRANQLCALCNLCNLHWIKYRQRPHRNTSGCNDVSYKWICTFVNTLRPGQDDCKHPDDIFKYIFLNDNIWISIEISLKFVLKGPINNISALVQIMAWRRPGDKLLSEPMMVSLLTDICVPSIVTYIW